MEQGSPVVRVSLRRQTINSSSWSCSMDVKILNPKRISTVLIPPERPRAKAKISANFSCDEGIFRRNFYGLKFDFSPGCGTLRQVAPHRGARSRGDHANP